MFNNEIIYSADNKVKNAYTRITFHEQACKSVPGFEELSYKFKKRISITGRAKSTAVNYIRHLAIISLHYKRLPTSLSSDDIHDYLYYAQQKTASCSESFFKFTIYSLRFLFKMEGLEALRIKLPRIKLPKKLPVVLSQPEVVNLLNKTGSLKHKTLIALLYGCGLRCGEATNMKLTDIDFERNMVHVKQGKGKKDRYVPLGKMLRAILDIYISVYKPVTWLFNGKHPKSTYQEYDKKYAQRSIQYAIRSAAKRAGILKPLNVHSLRHSFATHLLENGLDIGSIKELLGHARIETTLLYLHVAQIKNKIKFSPIDYLTGVKILQGVQCELPFDEEIL